MWDPLGNLVLQRLGAAVASLRPYFRGTTSAFDTRQSIAEVARTEAPEVAESVQVSVDFLRDRRLRAASDCVTQVSSQEAADWDIQLCYGCTCGCIPLKASCWLLLKNPGGREFWACASCSCRYNGGTSPRYLF